LVYVEGSVLLLDFFVIKLFCYFKNKVKAGYIYGSRLYTIYIFIFFLYTDKDVAIVPFTIFPFNFLFFGGFDWLGMIDYYVGQESLFMGDVSLESFNYGYNDKPFNNGLYMMEGSSSGQGGQPENLTPNSPNTPDISSDHPYIETSKKGSAGYKEHLGLVKEGKTDTDNFIHLCTLKNCIIPDFHSLKITLYEAYGYKVRGIPALAHDAYNHPEFK
jgi:hypothetical protein